MKATIIMPLDAPALKIAATKGYGATVIMYDRYKEDREAIGKKLASETGATLIPPYNHADVMAGQGTAAMELIKEVGKLDHLFVCVGGGGLISGCALAAKALSPGCKVHGVEPEAGNDAQQSLAAGKIIRFDTAPKTICDGAQTLYLGDLTFGVMQKLVSNIFTVSDAEIIECMKFVGERMKMVVEPTGVLGLAGLKTCGLNLKGKKCGVIVSGGNVDLIRYAKLISS